MTIFGMIFGVRAWKTSGRAVITDVTRMQGDNVCIAALNGRDGVRLHDPSPKEQWLRSIGGLTPGDIVSLTWRLPRHYRRPHLEDRDWNPASIRKVDRLSEVQLVDYLSATAFGSIKEALGKPCFLSEKGNAAFPTGRGSRSLASIKVESVKAYPYGDGVRTDFQDARREWTMVPIEDLVIRDHQAHCHFCRTNLAAALSAEFEGTQAVLRVGLGRPFQAGESPPACWLQVNHIFHIPPKRQHLM